MSSATEGEGPPAAAPPDSGQPDSGQPDGDSARAGDSQASQQHRRPGAGFATAAVALGAAGFSLVTIVPGVVFGIVGLRRAAAGGPGRVRSWLGIGLSAVWAAAGIYALPHLIRAADPGCTAYKGAGLTAYNKVIADLAGQRPGSLTADITGAIAGLRTAAGKASSAATARDLTELTGQLRAVLGDIRTGTVVPGAALDTLNRDSARADSACGTLRV